MFQHDNISVHEAASMTTWNTRLELKKLSDLDRGLTLSSLRIFGMNWNTDSTEEDVAQSCCEGVHVLVTFSQRKGDKMVVSRAK